MTAAYIVTAVGIVALFSMWAVTRWEDQRVIRDRLRATVTVTLKHEQVRVFTGVLFEYDRRVLVLRNAVEESPQATVPVDGELVIQWADVSYLQRVEGGR